MCDEAPITFRTYYELLYADKHSPLSTADQAHAIVSAFVDYRRALNLPRGPMNAPQGAKLIYKLIYHKRMMQAAEASQQSACAERHWKAVLDNWNCFLYAIYADDACHPARTPSLAIYQRIRLWWARAHALGDAPPALPRRAWQMVWAVDSIRDRMMIVRRCAECERKQV